MGTAKALLITGLFVACYIIAIDLVKITVHLYRKFKKWKHEKNRNLPYK